MESTETVARVELPGFECLRCGHRWHPRKEEEPVCCAWCKSPYWKKEPPGPVGARKRHEKECKTCVGRN